MEILVQLTPEVFVVGNRWQLVWPRCPAGEAMYTVRGHLIEQSVMKYLHVADLDCRVSMLSRQADVTRSKQPSSLCMQSV